ncbi:unnamed protein product, partial [Polarella glacialis]
MRPELPRATKPFSEEVAPFLSEFVGTYLLVFTIGVCSVAGDSFVNPAAVASMLTVLVYAFGPVSGGHLNPAVSVSAGLVGKMSWPKVGAYVLLQMSAGLLAGTVCFEVFGEPMGVAPVPPFGFRHAAFFEMLYTAMLCFVVLNVTAARNNNPDGDQNHYFGLAIGFAVVAGGYAAGNISGAVFNPAAALGLDVVGSKSGLGRGPWGLAYA